MCLRNGMRITRYLYSDTGNAATRVARHRCNTLSQRYTDQFPPGAWADAFNALPQDVRQIGAAELKAAGGLQQQWLVVAGWECQDLSSAGNGSGLDGEHSSTFHDLVRIVGMLQQLQPTRPPAYLFENAPMQYNHTHPQVRDVFFPQICSIIGHPTVLDAAQFGARAHRLRNFWTNMATPEQLQVALSHFPRPNVSIADILPSHLVTQMCSQAEPAPWYPCNIPCQRRRVLPTFVAYTGSHNFCAGKAGSIIDLENGREEEPSVPIRELALGYELGATDVEGITLRARHELTGRCMDQQCLQHLLAMCIALHATWTDPLSAGGALTIAQPTHPLSIRKTNPVTSGIDRHAGGETTAPVRLAAVLARMADRMSDAQLIDNLVGAPDPDEMVLCKPHTAFPTAMNQQQQAIQIQEPLGWTTTDIHRDARCLHYLRHANLSEAVTPRELRRVQRRAQAYRLQGETLYRVMQDGAIKRCPAPGERPGLITAAHANGHLGVRRTMALLRLGYWWYNMAEEVQKHVANCGHCDRVNRTASPAQPQLQPLEVMGPFYRWGIDLAGPLPGRNLYVLVAIEHFTKHIELMAIPDKTAPTTARCLMDIIARFGAPAEIVTDQGTEFLGPFEQLLQRCFIDHRTTSAAHPQSNGAAERIVQVVKKALRKHIADRQRTDEWDEWMPWLALGYRCSPQKSTGFSPYYLMYGVHPCVPPAIMERFEAHLDFDGSEQVREKLERVMYNRSRAIQDACVSAGHNLAIAQHRDTLRYAHTRSGEHLTYRRPFQVGDYVYIRRLLPLRSTLQVVSMPIVWRIVEINPIGTAILRSHTGKAKTENVERLILCHRTDLDPIVDPRLVGDPHGVVCRECGNATEPHTMIPCHSCPVWTHRSCAEPPVPATTKKPWTCPSCKLNPPEVVEEDEHVELFPSKIQRVKDAEAAKLHGRKVRKQFISEATGQLEYFEGAITYLGPSARPRYFGVYYAIDDDYEELTLKHVLPWLVPEQPAEPSAPGLRPRALARQQAQQSPAPVQEGPSNATQGHDVTQPSATDDDEPAIPRPHTTNEGTQAIQQPSEAGPSTQREPRRDGRTSRTIRRPARITLTTGPAAPVPQELDLSTVPAALVALGQQMPGVHNRRAAEEVVRCVEFCGPHAARQQHKAILADDVLKLLQAVDFSRCATILDPWSGSGVIAAAFATRRQAVVSSDWQGANGASLHGNPLQSGMYRVLQQRYGSIDAIVFSAWTSVLDVAIPVAVHMAKAVVCTLVPSSYVTDAPAPRLAWLNKLHTAGRLALVVGTPQRYEDDARGTRCTWLCIFSTPHERQRMMRYTSYTAAPLPLALE